jgi:BirA family biotin operon repressor/biotin-[acetyl-CoA-carboxylase] ligase
LAIRIFFSTGANVGGVDDLGPNARPVPPGWTVNRVTETGSTNADLLADAAARPDRSVLVAEHQTAGRGRLDRRWEAPAGANLLVSILFHDVPRQPSELTRRVALAAADACRELAGIDVALKWPNDLLVGEAKLAGILAERNADGSVVVGMGLNVGWAPPGAARLATSETDPSLTPDVVLAAFLAAYDALPADCHERYRAALGTLRRRVRVELPAGFLEGTAVDVEPDGRLVVVDTCAVTHRLAAGDVIHLRPA